ncbi:MAG: insulinase family protein [Bacteroidetes bacterium]|nr:MAG: insulinase family protein [Bacteroidota bacterium]
MKFSRFELDNGLRVLIHEDKSTPMVAVNILYDVGSRDESPDQTGFAHLFEHLMFGGSANVPDFDEPIQMAGGDNNAFTNNDITNFYEVLPAENLEVALWLESDRMLSLNFDQRVLDVQRKVVVEEFKETCLNQPYGDAWHHIAEMAYQVHPYRWPTIGKTPEHVEQAKMEDVRRFFYKYYGPNNAILTITGNVDPQKTRNLVEKWFGDIPRRDIPKRNLPAEPEQQVFKEKTIRANVPMDAVYLAFHAPSRHDEDYYVSDLLSDILCNGPSSRLYRRLLKNNQLFSHIDCYITGNVDPGLLIVEGKPAKGVTIEQAKSALWAELENLRKEVIPDQELQKWKNKIESTLVFSEAGILNKAINLAFFELLGDANQINEEVHRYEKITREDIHRVAQKILRKENCTELVYLAEPLVVAQ